MRTILDHIVRTAASGHDAPRGNIRRQFKSAHDMWIYTLKTLGESHPYIDGISNLAGDIRRWRHSIDRQANSRFKLCFRLEEPTDYSDWRVSYLVQSKDDPSMMVAADQNVGKRH